MAYHGYYTAPNPLGEYPLLCVDMWRIENGKIHEHWDALAPMPAHQVLNATKGTGNGEVPSSSIQREANQATVKRFLDHVLNAALPIIKGEITIEFTSRVITPINQLYKCGKKPS